MIIRTVWLFLEIAAAFCWRPCKNSLTNWGLYSRPDFSNSNVAVESGPTMPPSITGYVGFLYKEPQVWF